MFEFVFFKFGLVFVGRGEFEKDTGCQGWHLKPVPYPITLPTAFLNCTTCMGHTVAALCHSVCDGGITAGVWAGETTVDLQLRHLVLLQALR